VNSLDIPSPQVKAKVIIDVLFLMSKPMRERVVTWPVEPIVYILNYVCWGLMTKREAKEWIIKLITGQVVWCCPLEKLMSERRAVEL